MGRKDDGTAQSGRRAARTLLPVVDEESIQGRFTAEQLPYGREAIRRFIGIWRELNVTGAELGRILSPSAPMSHSTPQEWGSARRGDVPYWAILMLEEAVAVQRGAQGEPAPGVEGKWDPGLESLLREGSHNVAELLQVVAGINERLPGVIAELQGEVARLTAKIDALEGKVPEAPPPATHGGDQLDPIFEDQQAHMPKGRQSGSPGTKPRRRARKPSSS